MKEKISLYLHDLLFDLVRTDSHIVLFITLLVIIVIVLDSVSEDAKKKSKKTGLDPQGILQTALGSKLIAPKLYISDMQGLSGTPDALIIENGYFIPVERKAFSNKIRDRYVTQLLVYMRLVEEFEGKKPPYGYLVLGPKARLVKIKNTEESQEKLQKSIDEMKAILVDENQTKPLPHVRKCKKCHVRDFCKFKI